MQKTACFIFSESKKSPNFYVENDYEEMIKSKIMFAKENFGVTNFICHIKDNLDLATAKSVLELKETVPSIILTCIIEKEKIGNDAFRDKCFPVLMHSDKKLILSTKGSENEINKMMAESSDITILLCDNNIVDFISNKSTIVKKAYFIENKRRTF